MPSGILSPPASCSILPAQSFRSTAHFSTLLFISIGLDVRYIYMDPPSASPPTATDPDVVDIDSIQHAQPVVAAVAVPSPPAIPPQPPGVVDGTASIQLDEDEDKANNDDDDDELQIVEARITKRPPRVVDDDCIEIVEEASVPTRSRPRRRADSEIEVVAVNPVGARARPATVASVGVEPARGTKCAACGDSIPPDREAVVLSRCRHTLSVEYAIRCITDGNGLAKNPMCVVPRCRAPLSEGDVQAALALPSADKYFEAALKEFHTWVEESNQQDEDRYYGPSYIQLPEFTPEMAKAALKQPVSADELVGDDFEGAYGILWEWDEDYVGDDNVKRGSWTCLACGEYVSVPQNNNNSNSNMEDDELMEIDGGIPEHPLYPHCDKARAYALMESIAKLSKVGEESDKPKPKARKTRSKSKRYRTAKSVSSSKRQRTSTGFAKGTGYAGKSGAEWKGTSAKMLDNTKKVDKAMAYWLAMIRCYILRTKDSPRESWPCYMRVLLRECMITEVLSKILINESIMDVGQRVAVYVAALRVVAALNDSPSLRLLVAEPCENGRSLADLVQSFSKQAALLSNGASQHVLEDQTKLLIKQIRKSIRGINRYKLLRTNTRNNGFELRVSMNPHDYHGLTDVDAINKAEAGKEKNGPEAVDADEIEVQEVEEKSKDDGVSEERKKKYMEIMKELQFATVPGLAQASSYRKEAPKRSASEVGKGKGMRRVVSEVSSLFSSLPMSWSSPILIRVDEDRYDFLRACLFGPEDTPYECGVFIFDIFLPPDYPDSPPKFRFLTTGGGRARFNPNLYSNGKVCLSLLNTWTGPSWTPASTILQVLVSIQSLILVPNPFFNEPGYEKMMGTPQGKERSKIYNINQHHNTINHAMLDQIRNPFAEFKVAIEVHFRLKRPTVEKVINGWLKESNEVHAKMGAKQNNNTKTPGADGATTSTTTSNGAGSMAAFAESIGAFFGGLPPGTVGGPGNPAFANAINNANGGGGGTPASQAMQAIQALGFPGLIGGMAMGMEKNVHHSMDMTPLVDKMRKLLDKLDGIVEETNGANGKNGVEVQIEIPDEDEDQDEDGEEMAVVEVD